jgi:hypothetical protein
MSTASKFLDTSNLHGERLGEEPVHVAAAQLLSGLWVTGPVIGSDRQTNSTVPCPRST